MKKEVNNIFGYIYKTTNLINNKIYIGQHKKPYFDNNYLGSGKNLLNSIKKYGKSNFKCELLEKCYSLNELNEREVYYIKFYKSQDKSIGYNITNGGNQISVTPCIAKKISDSQKRNYNDKQKGKRLRKILSEANKGKKLSFEHIEKLREKAHTRQITDEERIKKSKKLLGHKPFWNNSGLTDEMRYKMGNAARGKHWFNDGFKELYAFECPSGFIKGRLPKSEETKRKIGESIKGRKVSLETRQKLSKTKQGKNNPQYGKVGTTKGKIAITDINLNKVKFIFPNELNYYQMLGFKKGNLRRKNL